ncbi:MAG: hypothetical protein R3B70_39245 [Polyangiaceae bacterium]
MAVTPPLAPRPPLADDRAPQSAPPDPAHPLRRLAHKYETLVELRRARARGEPLPEKAVFQSLAREWPGALYELDRLPLEDIESRLRSLRATLEEAAPEQPWMRPSATTTLSTAQLSTSRPA